MLTIILSLYSSARQAFQIRAALQVRFFPSISSCSYSQKIRPGRCPDPEIIAVRMLMINRAQEVSGRFPASLIYCG
jgi:hypothetical protein